MFSAACNRLNSSLSYTAFFVLPKQFSGFPRNENTACVCALRLVVMEPLAESPSVMKIIEFSP